MMPDQDYVPGFPRRMGEDLAALFAKRGTNSRTFDVVHGAQTSKDEVKLSADEDAIYNAADRASRECHEQMVRCLTIDAGLLAVQYICEKWDVDIPESVSGDQGEIISKVVDLKWWRRQLRKVVARRVEHAAIMAGLVGKGAQPYISNESAIRQAKRNRANRKSLENSLLRNEEGHEFSMADLADKGQGNKKNRRNEMMTRIRGFEEVAQLLNHAALFWTVTAPSKFHSVGGTNPKYNGASPRDVQRYFCEVWARIRAQLDREGIRPYGFRVVEPHTDGCPHWHMLFFVERKDVQRMAKIIYEHAMREDGDEAGAEEYRVKLVNISHDNGGSATAYIAKYIAKNIDGEGVGIHTSNEFGEEITVSPEVLEKMVITPSMRVCYWSQVWGIRQFQQIGGVPVGIYREFRRIKESTIDGAPDAVRNAWYAAQAIKSENPDEAKQADFAAFMQALGGPRTGRQTLVKLAKEKVVISGRYARYALEKPIGVYAVSEPDVLYQSVRYVWERVGEKMPIVAGVPPWGFGPSRTCVNNCTQAEKMDRAERAKQNSDALKNKKIFTDSSVKWWDEERTVLRPDRVQVETFLNHRKAGPPSHLAGLKAKYREV